jgi:hypothetical protein
MLPVLCRAAVLVAIHMAGRVRAAAIRIQARTSYTHTPMYFTGWGTAQGLVHSYGQTEAK